MSDKILSVLKKNLPIVIATGCIIVMIAGYFLPYIFFPKNSAYNISVFQVITTVGLDAIYFLLGFLMLAVLLYIMFFTFWDLPLLAIAADVAAVGVTVGLQAAIGFPSDDTFAYGAGYYMFLAGAVGNAVGNIMKLIIVQNKQQAV